MRRKPLVLAAVVCTASCSLGSFASAVAGYPIAGVEPYQRPAGAPVIQQVDKSGGWYSQALTGISQPYPSSLNFLEDQGNWYTPFNRPGIPGRYDIRGWYR